MDEPIEQSGQIKMVYIEPGGFMLVGVLTGFLCGLGMVALDPWLRFPDVPIRLNWREALLTASMLGAYAAVMGWILTLFWRSWLLWLLVVMFTPIMAVAVAAWNNLNAVFGLESDFLIFLPAALVFNLTAMGLMVLSMRLALHHPARRKLVYLALPITLTLLTFLGLARLRWSNQDAKDVVEAINTYAGGLSQPDYSIELLSVRYSDQLAPVGDAYLHTEAGDLLCRVRLLPMNAEISCTPKE